MALITPMEIQDQLAALKEVQNHQQAAELLEELAELLVLQEEQHQVRITQLQEEVKRLSRL